MNVLSVTSCCLATQTLKECLGHPAGVFEGVDAEGELNRVHPHDSQLCSRSPSH